MPSADPGLGFREYALALTEAIRGGLPPQFTIGVYGEWGSGKSSLLNAVAGILEAPESNSIPVQFDAWRYERAHIVVPLLHAIYATVAQLGEETLAESLRGSLTALIDSLTFKLGPLNLDVGKMRKARGHERVVSLDDAFSKPFSELRKIPDALGDRRIVVLIDDLDRCSPESVVAVLESINLVLDVPGFIFVLALDYDVLVSAVATKYPYVSGHIFIEKMIQVPFRVPRLDVDNPGLFHELIPNWADCARRLPPNFASYARDIAGIGLDANPRRVKRMVNSLLLLSRIVAQRSLNIDYELLTSLIGFQLRWPEQYRQFSLGVFTGSDQSGAILLGDGTDPTMQRYGERFFGNLPQLEGLRQLLQLTETVASKPPMTPASGDPPASAQPMGEHEKLGRNMPCWCGSGKKFKLCHGR